MGESSAFVDRVNKSNAQRVYRTLYSSARSRYVNRWIGFITSYPRAKDDFTQRKRKEAKDNPRHYADKAASWEVRDDRTIEDYAQDLKDDPDFAWMAYGCQPKEGTGRFFSNAEALKLAFLRGVQPEVVWLPTSTIRTTPNGPKEHVGVDILGVTPDEDAIYIAHGDPGFRQDRFTLCIGRLGRNFNPDLELPEVEIVALVEWEPNKEKQLEVDFFDVARVIKLLDDHFHFYQVTTDMWNAAMLIQKLTSEGVNIYDLTFSGKQQLMMYINARTMINNYLLNIVPFKIILKEMSELEETNTRPDHPSDGSKDAADCVVSIAWHFSKDEMLLNTHQTDISDAAEMFNS